MDEATNRALAELDKKVDDIRAAQKQIIISAMCRRWRDACKANAEFPIPTIHVTGQLGDDGLEISAGYPTALDLPVELDDEIDSIMMELNEHRDVLDHDFKDFEIK